MWVVTQRRNRASISPERIRRLEDLGFIWDPNTEVWEEGLANLNAFKEREGHCQVPVGYHEGGFALGRWVSRQRSEGLSSDRKEKLDALGFAWDALAERWEEAISHLQSFKKREGHCKVPTGHKEDDFKLGQWVRVQRTQKDHISPDRKQRLDDLEFVWEPLTQAWEEAFNHLQSFKDREGHCKVPQNHKEGGFPLRQWVTTQRSNLETLSLDRRERLENLGFVWDPLTDAWEEAFRKLHKYEKREGHCRVPQRHKEDDFKLGTWVSAQRAKRDTVDLDRKQRLDDLGFIWDASKDKT